MLFGETKERGAWTWRHVAEGKLVGWQRIWTLQSLPAINSSSLDLHLMRVMLMALCRVLF